MGDKQSSLLWYVFAGVLLVAFFELFLAQSQVATIPYSDFKTLLAAGKVTEATIGQDTIQAVVDLNGAEKLLPAAEYKQIKQPTGGQGSGLPLEGFAPAVPPASPPRQPTTGKSAPAAPAGKAVPQQAAAPTSDLHEIQTHPVNDPQLVSELQAAHVRYSAAPQNVWLSTLLSWVLPVVVLVAVWSFMLRRGSGGGVGTVMGVGLSRAKV